MSTPSAAAGDPSHAGPPPAPIVWSPPLWRVGVYALGGLVTALVAALGPLAERVGSLDAAGRLLVGVLAGGFWALAGRDLVARPALRVDAHGVDLVDGLRRRHLPWAAVIGVRAGTLTHNRRAVHLRTLEVETIDGPILLTRRQLGTDPGPVAERVEELRRSLG
ncbi:PH domain-containing protein [Frankia sp. AgKG'84/4]